MVRKKAQFYIIGAIAILLLTYALLSFMRATITLNLYQPIASSGVILNTKISEDMEYLNRTVENRRELDFLVPWYFDRLSSRLALKGVKISWYYDSSAEPRYVIYEIVTSEFYLKKRIFLR